MMQVRTRYGVCTVIVVESEASVMFSLGMLLLLLRIVGEEVVLESAPEVYETLLIFNVVGASDDAP